MTSDMNTITLIIGHWLKKNNIETEGTSIVLELPSHEAACRARIAIKREIEPLMSHITTREFGEIETMNGVGLTLRSKQG